MNTNLDVKIILNMIVKNESHLSFTPYLQFLHLIDGIVIYDTGSNDNTITIANEFLETYNIPGIVFKGEWNGFDKSRNDAILKAREWATNKPGNWYLWFFDADDYIYDSKTHTIISESVNFTKIQKLINKKSLNLDFYKCKFKSGDYTYTRVVLANLKASFKYIGILHEYLEYSDLCTVGMINAIYVASNRTGNRSMNPDKYLNDSKILKSELEKIENSNTLYYRYLYYYAQSLKDYLSELNNRYIKLCDKNTEAGKNLIIELNTHRRSSELAYAKRAYESKLNDDYTYISMIELSNYFEWFCLSIDDSKYLKLLESIQISDSIKLQNRTFLYNSNTLKILHDAYECKPYRVEATYKLCKHYFIIQKYNLGLSLLTYCLECKNINTEDVIFENSEISEFEIYFLAIEYLLKLEKYSSIKKYLRILKTNDYNKKYINKINQITDIYKKIKL